MAKEIIYDWFGEPVLQIEDGIATALKDCKVNIGHNIYLPDTTVEFDTVVLKKTTKLVKKT